MGDKTGIPERTNKTKKSHRAPPAPYPAPRPALGPEPAAVRLPARHRRICCFCTCVRRRLLCYRPVHHHAITSSPPAGRTVLQGNPPTRYPLGRESARRETGMIARPKTGDQMVGSDDLPRGAKNKARGERYKNERAPKMSPSVRSRPRWRFRIRSRCQRIRCRSVQSSPGEILQCRRRVLFALALLLLIPELGHFRSAQHLAVPRLHDLGSHRLLLLSHIPSALETTRAALDEAGRFNLGLLIFELFSLLRRRFLLSHGNKRRTGGYTDCDRGGSKPSLVPRCEF